MSKGAKGPGPVPLTATAVKPTEPVKVPETKTGEVKPPTTPPDVSPPIPDTKPLDQDPKPPADDTKPAKDDPSESPPKLIAEPAPTVRRGYWKISVPRVRILTPEGTYVDFLIVGPGTEEEGKAEFKRKAGILKTDQPWTVLPVNLPPALPA